MEACTATKHEGAGNDFLVVLDPDDAIRLRGPGPPAGRPPPRHRGRRDHPGGSRAATGADLSMQLHNADGGEAEMSGNGIRCLAQAAVEAGLVGPAALHRGDRRRRAHGRLHAREPSPVGPGPAWTWVRSAWDRSSPGGRRPAGPDGRRGEPASGAAGAGHGERRHRRARAQAGGRLPRRHQREWITARRGRREGELLECGSGSAASARRWPAGPAAWPRRRRPGSWGVVAGDGPVRVRNPGGTVEVTLGGRR